MAEKSVKPPKALFRILSRLPKIIWLYRLRFLMHCSSGSDSDIMQKYCNVDLSIKNVKGTIRIEHAKSVN